ncbi:MAG: hypothetical protein WC784_04135 [Candidatus Shapirobacteria bacterium]|jgi:hypothetical protein
MPKKIIEKQMENGELSYDTKTLITVITLVTVYPVGLILMFAWMKWNKWLKILIAFPVILILLVPICLFLGLIIGGISLMGRPETRNTFETMRETIRQEMMISPTGVVTPTIGVVKK